MARHSVCLIHGHDAELLKAGIELRCSDHSHIDREKAQLYVSGAGLRPWLDDSYIETGRRGHRRASAAQISERHDATAFWAQMNDGTTSAKYLVLVHARDWQVRHGSMEYLPLGSTKQRPKMGRTHFRRKHSANRAGFTVNRRVDTTQTPAMLAKAVCRPSLMRKPVSA